MGGTGPHRTRDDRHRRRHVHADLSRKDRRGEVHQRNGRRSRRGHYRLLQIEGRHSRRRHSLGERAWRGGRGGACGEDLRHQAACGPLRARRGAGREGIPDQRSARRRHLRGFQTVLAIGEESLVQRRPAARDGRPRRSERSGGDAPRNRRQGQRRLLSRVGGREICSLRESGRRPDHGQRSRRAAGERRRADSHQLQRHRGLRVSAQLARSRDAAGDEHPRRHEPALHAPQQRAVSARGDRSAQALVRRPQQVRRRPEVRATDPDEGDALEGIRGVTPDADQPRQGD